MVAPPAAAVCGIPAWAANRVFQRVLARRSASARRARAAVAPALSCSDFLFQPKADVPVTSAGCHPAVAPSGAAQWQATALSAAARVARAKFDLYIPPLLCISNAENDVVRRDTPKVRKSGGSPIRALHSHHHAQPHPDSAFAEPHFHRQGAIGDLPLSGERRYGSCHLWSTCSI